MLSKILLSVSFLTLAAGIPAQTTHLVGPNGLPQIRDALAIAGPGDTILVEPGTYAQFTADVGVTIRAITPGTVQVVADLQFVNCQSVFCIPAVEAATYLRAPQGQAVVIDGINFPGTVTSSSSLPGSWGTRVAVESGRAVLVDCILTSQIVAPGLEVNGAKAHLIRCQVSAFLLGRFAGTTGLEATDATVTMIDCFVSGAGGFQFTTPGPGARLTNTELHLSNTVLGAGGQISGISTPGLIVDPRSTVWISDSTVIGDPASCPVIGGPNVRLVRTDYNGGTGCPTFETGSLLGVEQGATLAAGAPFTLRFASEPLTFVGVVASFALDDRDLPVLEQPWFSTPNPITAAILVTDAQGDASATWTIPAVLQGEQLYFHGASGAALPLQTSPVAGGVVR